MNSMKEPLWRQKKVNALFGVFVALVVVGAATPVQATAVDDAVATVEDTVDAAAPATNGCHKTKGGGGAGDNHAKCRMTCDADLYLSISVDSADDEGRFPAGVSGEVDCGGGNAHCSGDEGHCSGGGSADEGAKTTSSGEADCKGKSDELAESQLTVECSAQKVNTGDIEPRWCPIYEPQKVCLEWLPPFVQDLLKRLIGGGEPGEPGEGDPLGAVAPVVADAVGVVADEAEDGWTYVQEVRHWRPNVPGVAKLLEKYGLQFGHDMGDSQALPVDATSVQTWDAATAIDPLLPWKAASHESYVWMHYDGAAALGINCYHGACVEFTPILVGDGTGLVLSTP